MLEADCWAVQYIESQCMGNPWSIAQIQSELTQACGLQLVAEFDCAMAGFVFFRYCLPEAELLRVAVSKERLRQGVGGVLLGEGLAMLKQFGVRSCNLEVRRSNLSAIHLYTRCGFVEIGRRPKYYSDPQEDAVLMQKNDLSPVWREH